MHRLPVEIIEIILNDPRLSIQDVINVSSTCRYLRQLVFENRVIWRNRYKPWRDPEHPSVDHYLQEIRYIFELRERVLVALKEMYFNPPDDSKEERIDKFQSIVSERPQSLHYMLVHLRQILDTNRPIDSVEVVPFLTPGNKTMHFCAEKVMFYFKRFYLRDKLKNRQRLEDKNAEVEQGACFAALWYQTDLDISFQTIDKQFNDLADSIRPRFAERIEKQAADFETLFSEIQNCLRDELGFGFPVNIDRFEYMYINKVLESRKGSRLMLEIVEDAVARRLGLNTQLYRVHEICLFVNPGGQFDTTPADDLCTNMTKNVAAALRMLAASYGGVIKYDNVVRLDEFLMDYFDWWPASTGFQFPLIIGKLGPREEAHKYAVGMLMRYRAKNGVIIGWTTHSKGVIGYDMLMENGTCETFVSEDELEPSTMQPYFWCKQLGRFFSHCFKNHFVPNAILERNYPHDTKLRHKFYCDSQLAQYTPK